MEVYVYLSSGGGSARTSQRKPPLLPFPVKRKHTEGARVRQVENKDEDGRGGIGGIGISG